MYNAITACTTSPLHWEKVNHREMVNFKKWDFFSILLYTFTIKCVTTGAQEMPIEYVLLYL